MRCAGAGTTARACGAFDAAFGGAALPGPRGCACARANEALCCVRCRARAVSPWRYYSRACPGSHGQPVAELQCRRAVLGGRCGPRLRKVASSGSNVKGACGLRASVRVCRHDGTRSSLHPTVFDPTRTGTREGGRASKRVRDAGGSGREGVCPVVREARAFAACRASAAGALLAATCEFAEAIAEALVPREGIRDVACAARGGFARGVHDGSTAGVRGAGRVDRVDAACSCRGAVTVGRGARAAAVPSCRGTPARAVLAQGPGKSRPVPAVGRKWSTLALTTPESSRAVTRARAALGCRGHGRAGACVKPIRSPQKTRQLGARERTRRSSLSRCQAGLFHFEAGARKFRSSANAVASGWWDLRDRMGPAAHRVSARTRAPSATALAPASESARPTGVFLTSGRTKADFFNALRYVQCSKSRNGRNPQSSLPDACTETFTRN